MKVQVKPGIHIDYAGVDDLEIYEYAEEESFVRIRSQRIYSFVADRSTKQKQNDIKRHDQRHRKMTLAYFGE